MSLPTLPPDTLSQIISRLPPSSRRSLGLTHPLLHNQIHPSNHLFWHDVLEHRFANRPSPPLLAYPNYQICAMRDLADDYFIHSKLPWSLLSRLKRPWSPLCVPSRAGRQLTIANCTAVSVFQKDHTWNVANSYYLESPATSLIHTQRRLVVGLSNGSIHLPQTPRTIRVHKSAVISLSHISPTTLVSSSTDKTIRITNLSTRKIQATLRGHDAPVLSTNVDNLIVSYSKNDNRVKLWDVTRACCIATARPGKVIHSVVQNGCVYTATNRCVHVLDARQSLATVAVLSLPRHWQTLSINKLHITTDGTLAACVGGGGVALWESRGGWVGRALGWAKRWEGRPGKQLTSLLVTDRAIVAGGGARELLTFSRSGGYEGLMVQGGSGGGVCDILKVADGVVVARDCGRVQVADCTGATVDWVAVERLWNGNNL